MASINSTHTAILKRHGTTNYLRSGLDAYHLVGMQEKQSIFVSTDNYW